jgi:hypothetical protein
MVLAIEVALALLVLIGSATVVWGVQHFKLSTRFLAVAFTITAASWIAFIITTIGITIKILVLPRV